MCLPGMDTGSRLKSPSDNSIPEDTTNWMRAHCSYRSDKKILVDKACKQRLMHPPSHYCTCQQDTAPLQTPVDSTHQRDMRPSLARDPVQERYNGSHRCKWSSSADPPANRTLSDTAQRSSLSPCSCTLEGTTGTLSGPTPPGTSHRGKPSADRAGKGTCTQPDTTYTARQQSSSTNH